MDLLFVSPVDEIVVVSVDNFVVFLFQKIKFKKFYSKSIEVKTSKLRSHQLFQAIRKRLAPRTTLLRTRYYKTQEAVCCSLAGVSH